MKLKDTTEVLQKLRKHMSNGICSGSQSLQAVIVPSSDAHNSEYLAPADERRAFISGFTGSAGTAVITVTQAAMWTDGRYFLQAGKEMDDNWTLMKVGIPGTLSIEDWLNNVLPPSSTVGVNAMLYSSHEWEEKSAALKTNGHKLINVFPDIVDSVWENKPAMPSNPLILLSQSTAGQSVNEKIASLRKVMERKSADWLVITALDDVAWLLNLRGSDIEFNPVFFSYAILGADKLHVFISESRLTDEVRTHLDDVPIEFHDYAAIFKFVENECRNGKVWISYNASYAIYSLVKKSNLISTMYNPVAEVKAVKNEKEIDGMKLANLRDSVALCQYFAWLEQEVSNGGNVTEYTAAKKALAFRQMQQDFVSLSFETISSSGPNGAIIHYKPSLDDDKPVTKSEVYLCDSGGQYLCGTTDTTRTMHFTEPTHHEKECFTRVLKGHIALSTIVFPKGIKGHMLDTLARMFLWKDGLNYNHGTGHGVGAFLNVHEGPVGNYIGNSERVTSVSKGCELEAGMIITDEPGYYEDGNFGIRIENALLCVKANTKFNFNGTQFLTFEPICYVPIQHKMIEMSMLTNTEIEWLNDYHEKCFDLISAEIKSQKLPESMIDWLKENTKKIVQ